MKHERLHVEVAALCSVSVASGKYIPSSVAMFVYGIEFPLLTTFSSRIIVCLNATPSLDHGAGPFPPAPTGQSTRAPNFPVIVRIMIDWDDGPRRSCLIGYGSWVFYRP